MDGGAASIPSNTLNNNFNAAVDLSSLFGGYHKIGEHGHEEEGCSQLRLQAPWKPAFCKHRHTGLEGFQ